VAAADSGVAAGSVAVSVADAWEGARVGTTAAGPGQRFTFVSLQLFNNTGAPLPLAFSQFSLHTDTGLGIAGDPATAQHEDGCPATASIDDGRAIACVIVFQGPPDRRNAVSYRHGDLHASAPLSVRPCTPCTSGECVDLQNDREHCGACDTRIPSEASCVQGVATCPDASHTVCGSSCVSMTDDPRHCGGCDQRCAHALTCEAGLCVVWFERQQRPPAYPCDLFCSDQGWTCVRQRAHYGDNGCPRSEIVTEEIESCSRPPLTRSSQTQANCQLLFGGSDCLCADL